MRRLKTSVSARHTSEKGGEQVQLCATPSQGNTKHYISDTHYMPLSSRLKGPRMMSPSGFPIQIRPLVTLRFNLLTPRWPVHVLGWGRFTPTVQSFSKYSVHKSVTDKRTDKQTNGRRDRSRSLRLRPVETGVWIKS